MTEPAAPTAILPAYTRSINFINSITPEVKKIALIITEIAFGTLVIGSFFHFFSEIPWNEGFKIVFIMSVVDKAIKKIFCKVFGIEDPIRKEEDNSEEKLSDNQKTLKEKEKENSDLLAINSLSQKSLEIISSIKKGESLTWRHYGILAIHNYAIPVVQNLSGLFLSVLLVSNIFTLTVKTTSTLINLQKIFLLSTPFFQGITFFLSILNTQEALNEKIEIAKKLHFLNKCKGIIEKSNRGELSIHSQSSEKTPDKLKNEDDWVVISKLNEEKKQQIHLKAVNNNGLLLKFVPRELMTQKMCLDAVNNNGLALEFVPQEQRTDNVLQVAVNQNGLALELIPDDQRTEEICKIAVAQNGLALELVPDDQRTEEICKIAVAQNGLALKYIDEMLLADLLTKDCYICAEKIDSKLGKEAYQQIPQEENNCILIALNQNGLALNLVPIRQRTQEMCLAAIRQNGLALEYVPPYLKTPDICDAAVKQNGLALEFLPVIIYDKQEIYSAAVKQNGLALKLVPEEQRTDKMYLDAVKQNGLALELVPVEQRTDKMLLEAVKQNYLALKFIQKEQRTDKIYQAAVKQNELALMCVPDTQKTTDICQTALNKNVFLLKYVPKEVMSEKMCLNAVNQNGLALKYVPSEMMTLEMCLAAVNQNGLALKYVPEELRTEKICLDALNKNGLALQFIQEDKRTEEMCLAAINQYDDAIKYAPIKILINILSEINAKLAAYKKVSHIPA